MPRSRQKWAKVAKLGHFLFLSVFACFWPPMPTFATFCCFGLQKEQTLTESGNRAKSGQMQKTAKSGQKVQNVAKRTPKQTKSSQKNGRKWQKVAKWSKEAESGQKQLKVAYAIVPEDPGGIFMFPKYFLLRFCKSPHFSFWRLHCTCCNINCVIIGIPIRVGPG